MKNNFHATGIVLGRHGFLIAGPSGSGKSWLARMLLQDARRNRLFSALISDDQVLLEACGETLIAHRPETIRDLMEIRFSGIVQINSVASAVMDAVLLPVALKDTTERLPDPDETMVFFSSVKMPVLRVCPALQPDIVTLHHLMHSRKTGHQ